MLASRTIVWALLLHLSVVTALLRPLPRWLWATVLLLPVLTLVPIDVVIHHELSPSDGASLSTPDSFLACSFHNGTSLLPQASVCLGASAFRFSLTNIPATAPANQSGPVECASGQSFLARLTANLTTSHWRCSSTCTGKAKCRWASLRTLVQ